MLKKIMDLGISELEAKTLITNSKNIKKDYKNLLKNTPIQYLIGNVNFYGYEIIVNKNVLIPRFETESLVEKVIELITKNNFKNPNILDLCTGSGCITVALSKNIKGFYTATDISKKAINVAKKNFNKQKLKIKVIKSDLFKKINESFDVIVSNPPYIDKNEELSKVVLNEPHIALFSEDSGMKLLKKIIHESKNHLNKKSILALEIGKNQYNELKKYAKKIYPDSKIIFFTDLNNIKRFLFILNNCE